MAREPVEARQTAILEAPAACSSNAAFAALRIQDVARQLGVSTGLIHYHFESEGAAAGSGARACGATDLDQLRADVAEARGPVAKLDAFQAYCPKAPSPAGCCGSTPGEPLRRPARAHLAGVRRGLGPGGGGRHARRRRRHLHRDKHASAWRISALVDGLAVQMCVHDGVVDGITMLEWARSAAASEPRIRREDVHPPPRQPRARSRCEADILTRQSVSDDERQGCESHGHERCPGDDAAADEAGAQLARLIAAQEAEFFSRQTRSAEMHERAVEHLAGGATSNWMISRPATIWVSHGKRVAHLRRRRPRLRRPPRRLRGHGRRPAPGDREGGVRACRARYALHSPPTTRSSWPTSSRPRHALWRFTNSAPRRRWTPSTSCGPSLDDRIIKIEGSYHGHHDSVMISAFVDLDVIGSVEQPASVLATGGLPKAITDLCVIVPVQQPRRSRRCSTGTKARSPG